jgi:ribonucleoside-diphosphate reductase alpha chain
MTTYSYEEALQASVAYFEGDELAGKVVVDKYLLRNSNNELVEKTPDDMHRRIAKEFARIEANKFKKPLSEDEIFSYLQGFKKIIPQGSPMYGIGNVDQYITLSNCYVLDPPEDSYTGIHWTDEQISHISKRRGGCGIDISKLRPNGSYTRNSSRTSTGILPFMERFSNSIREVGQGGRRGALMLTINVHHPEVLDFATVKNDLKKVTGANISIRLTDEFLKAVVSGEEYEQRWPVEIGEIKLRKKTDARTVWKEIIKNAHAMAEPGLLFWDNIIRNSPADCYAEFGFGTVSTNPCSELPLSALDSCRLLLLNLYTYVKNAFTKDARFDFDEFYHDVKIAQRLMDNLVDLEVECIDRILGKIKRDPESDELKAREIRTFERIKENCLNGRRTGTGITALGDTLAALGIKYDSDEGLDMTEKIYMALKLGAYESSIEMAEEIGPFPVWDKDVELLCDFFDRFYADKLELSGRIVYGEDIVKRMAKSGRRNIALLTSAPAGSVSILTRTSSGIEPVIWLSYFRKKKGNLTDEHFRVDFTDDNGDKWMEFKVYHPKLQEWMNVTGETDETKSPWHGSCANDLDWKQRVYLQARANKHVDHAISSTLNLPKDVTVDKVAEIYETAWKAGCKGITVYRDGCRDGVMTTESAKAKEEITERPKAVDCDIHHVTVKGKQYFVLVGKIDDKPYEVFAGKNGFLDKEHTSGIIIRQKKGFYKLVTHNKDLLMAPITQASTEEEETVTRLASLALQSDVSVHKLVQQLEKVNGELHGFAKAVARVMKKYIPDGTEEHGESCPTCESKAVVRQEGCVTCKSCGWSKCL